MALASIAATTQMMRGFLQVSCRKKERERDHHHGYPFKVVDITPPPRSLGVQCFPSNIHCGESVTIEGKAYTVSAVIHRYQLRKGKYEPSERRIDVQSTGQIAVRKTSAKQQNSMQITSKPEFSPKFPKFQPQSANIEGSSPAP